MSARRAFSVSLGAAGVSPHTHGRREPPGPPSRDAAKVTGSSAAQGLATAAVGEFPDASKLLKPDSTTNRHRRPKYGEPPLALLVHLVPSIAPWTRLQRAP